MKPSARLKRLHFIGIGGAGMSVLAEVLAAWGFRISGSDSQDGETLDRLRESGIRVETGHRAENLGETDAVVYSAAVPADNPELVEARRLGVPAVKRAEMLGEALRGKYSLAVSGTHGKTTTTTMLGSIWLRAGREPTLLAGGTARGENLSALAGKGSVLIVEADEFDRSFLAMRCSAAIINNIDTDHLDCYGTLDAVREAFVAFAEALPFYGLVAANIDDAGVRSILPRLTRKVVAYGLSEGAAYRAVDVRARGQGMSFTLERGGTALGAIELAVPGTHNVYNALAAAALSIEEGLSFDEVALGLREYPGVQRRMEHRGTRSGVSFYDDYAHHPTEVAAALQAARALLDGFAGPGRLIAVFQPHLYSRTQQLYKEFARAFQGCDALFVTRVFASREKSIPGVEGHLIATEAKAGILGHENIQYVDDPGGLPAAVAGSLRPGDLVLTMGAGDIGSRGARIMEALA